MADTLSLPATRKTTFRADESAGSVRVNLGTGGGRLPGAVATTARFRSRTAE